ncbi:hypothetical protein CFC21_073387 [Triticum aestivum]|uniref:Uncharacterized protein n=3 Tax=Triticum TaxID=4564 RepID=A0A9R0XGW7_TRITD|nr:uncharacterized protein LOC119310136 [Triticum dicoccoides]XP_044393723.1 uncharacterized protein LOC123116919 [Triticum aestivum]KAF7067498.1 hypothetical protein CFC21_073387 [Triticum aestivum]VAI36286.1 unnamed protein product [Triticum turgidum subsp. durum]
MDADAQAPEAPSSPPPPRSARSRPSSWSSSGSSEYTSLRDVLSELGNGGGGGSSSDLHDFDTSNIPIRNQLLKHAASAYLQSAIVVTPRERGCLSRAWRRRCRILLRPCPECECDVDVDPVRRCAAALAGSVRRVLASLCGCVACVWT